MINSAVARSPEDAFIERRTVPRLATACPARLLTAAGTRSALITDLSAMGARLQVDPLPLKGCTALLQWDGHERICMVMWAKDGECGLRFDRPLLVDDLSETVENRPPRPSARLCEIPQGSRRASLVRRAEGGE